MKITKAGERSLSALLMEFSAKLTEIADALETATAYDVAGMIDVFSQSVDSVREIASESDSKYEKIENEYLREIA